MVVALQKDKLPPGLYRNLNITGAGAFRKQPPVRAVELHRGRGPRPREAFTGERVAVFNIRGYAAQRDLDERHVKAQRA